eukprot:3055949-Pyramimonas_sp.AAC.1
MDTCELRPFQHRERTGADAEAKASNVVADMFVGVRGALAYPKKLQACPKKIVYQAVTPTGEGDPRSDSGYRRLSGDADDEIRGYGIRGANLLRRGRARAGGPVVHLVDAHCKSHRFQ